MTSSSMIDQMEWPSHLCSLEVWLAYRRLFAANAKLFDNDPRHNLSAPGHPTANEFGRYLMRWRRGRLLDIGCGPLPWPVYLRDYNPDMVCGIDPLPIPTTGLFQKRQAIAEDIPFETGHFATVVAATSLDHLLNIEAALREIRRVLVQGGNFVAWVRYWPGSPIYDPFTTDPLPPDPHHLYHLDAWFEDIAHRFGLHAIHYYTPTTKPGLFVTFE